MAPPTPTPTPMRTTVSTTSATTSEKAMARTRSATKLAARKFEEPGVPSIYFGGCAFGAAFYNGVYEAMVDTWGIDFLDHVFIGGDSVGAIFAIALGLKKDPPYLERLYRKISDHCCKHGPIIHGSVLLEECARELIGDDVFAYKRLEGRIFVGTTAFFARHRWHLSWHSNEDLIECLTGSWNIPFYCVRNKFIKNIVVLDGAYSFAGTDLPHGDNTLFVGIDPHAEITRTYTNSEMFYAPTPEQFTDFSKSGYLAFQEWNKHKTLNAKVGNRKPNYQALTT